MGGIATIIPRSPATLHLSFFFSPLFFSLSFSPSLFATEESAYEAMSLTPIPYDDFIEQNSLLIENGGPWSCVGLGNEPCQQVNASWTDDQMSIYSYLENADLAGDHAMFLQTAISFDPSEFGSSGQLAYTWAFIGVARSSTGPEDGGVQVQSIIGDELFTDHIEIRSADDNSTWANVTSFLHYGLLSSDPLDSPGLLNISIYISSSYTAGELGIDLRSLKLAMGVPSPSTPASSNPLRTLEEPRTMTVIISDNPSTSLASNSSPAPSNGSPSTIIAVVLGSILGGVMIFLLILLLLCIRKRRQKVLPNVELSPVEHLDVIHLPTLSIERPVEKRNSRSGTKIRNVRRPSPLVVNRDIEGLQLSIEEALITPYFTPRPETPAPNLPQQPTSFSDPQIPPVPPLPAHLLSTTAKTRTPNPSPASTPASSTTYIPILPPNSAGPSHSSFAQSSKPRKSLKKSRPGPNLAGFEIVTPPIQSPSTPSPASARPSSEAPIAIHKVVTVSTDSDTMRVPILAPYHTLPTQYHIERSRTAASSRETRRSTEDGLDRSRTGVQSNRPRNSQERRHRSRTRRDLDTTHDDLPSYTASPITPIVADDSQPSLPYLRS